MEKKPSPIKQAVCQIRAHIERTSFGKKLYAAFLIAVFAAMLTIHTTAADTTIWTKAKELMQDVYTQVLTISTIAAVVTAAVALLLMNFSKNGKTVDESRAWLKRIIITWAILNALGFYCHLIEIFNNKNLSQKRNKRTTKWR